MAKKIKEVVLALSGGGSRGAYHLGVLQYIDEQNIKVKAICSTSIGSIIASSYASGVSPKEQLEIYKSKETKNMFSFVWFKESIFKIDMKSSTINSLLKKDRLEDLDIPVYVTALNLQNGDEDVFESGDIRTICKASCALVPMFKPVEYNGNVYIDGGIYNHMPYEPLKKYKLPIVGINIQPLVKKPSKKSLMSYYKKAKAIQMYNKVDKEKDVYDFYLSNDKLASYSILSLKHFDELFEMGYADAQKFLVNV